MTRLTYPAYYYPDILQILILLTDRQNEDGMWRLQRPYNERRPHRSYFMFCCTFKSSSTSMTLS
jgi:hypothetical protein